MCVGLFFPGNMKTMAKIEMTQNYLEEFVLFTKLHRLLPSVVTLVQVGGDATEFNQVVFLQGLSKCYVVEVVKGID